MASKDWRDPANGQTVEDCQRGPSHPRRGGRQVKERPILFSGPMVRAILDGRKTQTRLPMPRSCWLDRPNQTVKVIRCPYEPGERLWTLGPNGSRITLEIVNVRGERLHDISEADAEAEGITGDDALIGQVANPFRAAFADLWESIHGPGSWEANPHVWVVEFKRLEGGKP